MAPFEKLDGRTALHILNRTTFGPRPGDVARIQAIGLNAYLDEQLHPERGPGSELVGNAVDAETRLAALTSLGQSSRVFATEYYDPMIKARQEFTVAQQLTPPKVKPAYLRWHLLPVAAMTLPGDKPVAVLGQSAVTPEELRFQQQNNRIFDELQSQKILRAVYSEHQLEEALTDFWFNHFNVDARKIEDRPVMVEYERDAIRPYVFGKFRDLLGATAKSPAMLFYLDNWMSVDPNGVHPIVTPARIARGPFGGRVVVPGTVRQPPQGKNAPKGLNENYGRELLELHTLGVDGGYTQKDVTEIARAFTGWTIENPRNGGRFVFRPQLHDMGQKVVLG
ncbi:MAG TPA: DUF1800 family protein, partial [Vicinamibacterales bacterium]|nr:DUF1800 family protein [Vicinamibacterales bacterium]